MAKKSSIEKNNHRRVLVARDAKKRAALKATVMDQSLSIEERFAATVKLASLPRNGAKVRIKNRCEVTSRVALRDLGNRGLVPGLVKSSW